jgi:UDP-2,4-diacetamido-2,4,6-trideoxy-beta-L-altropyranose hydrolase
MNIVIRTDASLEIGTGHFVRCLTLADALKERGGTSRFLCRNLPEHLRGLLDSKGHTLLPLGPGDGVSDGDLAHSAWLRTSQQEDGRACIEALEEVPCDWLIVDHYALDERWESPLRKRAKNIFVIDDLADRNHDCDLLLDQNLLANSDERYAGKVSPSCKMLLGTVFALLQPEYANLRARVHPRTGPIRRILVYFGGSDIRNLTGMAIEAFQSLPRKGLELDFVLPAETSRVEEIRSRLSCSSGIRFYSGLPTLAHLMAGADLAIGAAGSTSWERCCLGLPSLVVSLAGNQMEVVRSLHEAGVVDWIGDISDMAPRRIEKALQKALALSTDLLRDWSLRCSEVCDGRGAERVVDNLFGGGSPA